jgi:hypothetical protein
MTEHYDWDEETWENRFDLYGALWAFCNRWHSGMNSRGYRILSRLSNMDYNPGLSLQQGHFETDNQREIYRELLKYRSEV